MNEYNTIRHIELSFKFDLTCLGSEEDFEIDTPEMITDAVYDYFDHLPAEVLENIKIEKIWYEKEV